MNNGMVLAGLVTPNNTAAPGVQGKASMKATGKGGLQTQDKPALNKDFKQQLEACEMMSGWEQLILQLQTLGYSSENKLDNSMCCDSQRKDILSGIVGILEGFELLDYQTDNVQAIPQKLTAMIETMIAKATDEQGSDLIASGENGEQQTNLLSEKVAWMLQDNQLKALPNKTQQEILQVVGEYLCSFESTNKRTGMPSLDKQPGIEQLGFEKQPGIEQPGLDKQPGIEQSGLDMEMDMDKLGTLLLKTKTVVSKDNTVEAKPNLTTEVVQTKQTIKNDVLSKSDSELGKQTASVMPGVSENRSEVKGAATAETQQQGAFVKDNVIKIVDKVNAHVSEGRYDFDIELKPDFLGKLNIKLTMENGELKMLIKTENMATKGLFNNEMPAMQNALKEKGVDISQINLTYEKQSFSGDERQAYQHNNSNNGRKRNWQNIMSVDQAATSVFYDAMMDAPDLMLKNSSVEYHA